MGLSFANPLALWALLGIPAILLVHMLQSRNRTVHSSTLFLLDHLAEDTRRGAVVTRIRNGAQLWLQLLAVLLLTLLLSQPRRVSEHSVQSLALVIDSSLSMQAFTEQQKGALREVLDALDGTAASLQWWVLPSDEALPRIGAGEGREALEATLGDLRFPSGGHDVSARIREARLLAGAEGLVVFLTDHAEAQVGSGAEVVSLGTPLPNVGISGIQVSEVRNGRATLRVGVVNPSEEPGERMLVAEVNGQEISRSAVSLGAGAMQTVEIPLTGGGRGVLRLEPGDVYPVDDQWPFVTPQPKPLTVSVFTRGPVADWSQRILGAVPGGSLGTGGQMEIRVSKGRSVGSEAAGDLQFVSGEATHPLNRVLPEAHPLVEGLNWEGLLVEPFAGFTPLPSDVVLLWMGEHPLVVLRPRNDGVSLLYLFDPETGNALRNGSLALLTHRFMSGVQEGLEAPSAFNVITGQSLEIPEGTLGFETLEGTPVEVNRAAGKWPMVPGWGRVTREETVQLEVGVANGEVEEGDFRKARPRGLSDEVVLEQRRQHEERDLLFPVWAGLLGLALLGSWKTGQEGPK